MRRISYVEEKCEENLRSCAFYFWMHF